MRAVITTRTANRHISVVASFCSVLFCSVLFCSVVVTPTGRASIAGNQVSLAVGLVCMQITSKARNSRIWQHVNSWSSDCHDLAVRSNTQIQGLEGV